MNNINVIDNDVKTLDFSVNPFFRVPPEVFDERFDLSTSEISVYVVLAMYLNNGSGEAYPSVNTIVKYAGCGISTVRRSLSSLKEKGLIDIEKRTGNNGRQTSNKYILLAL